MRADSIVSKAIRLSLAVLMVATLMPLQSASASGVTAPAPIGSGEPNHAQIVAGESGVAGAQLPAPSPRRAVVQWRSGIPRHQIEAAGRRLGFRVVSTSQELGWTLVEPTGRRVTPDALLEKLREARLTSRAEVESFFHTQAVLRPNDPRFDTLWGLDNTGQTGGTPDADVDAPEAWANLGTGSDDVVVAVIDTGADLTHPDLIGNRWVNTDEIPNNGRDDDRNGYIDDRFGYDFYNRDATVFDAADGDEHGTHVAGTIGAVGNEGAGVAGVTWDVTLMPVKFIGPHAGGNFEAAEAIVYAVDNGADIINASWGGAYSDVVQEAVEYAAQHGVLFVAAAGNLSVDNDIFGERFFPASSESTNVVTVAATDHNDQLASFSNFGRNTVEVAAPGVDINSTLPWATSALFINSPPYRLVYLAMAAESVEPTSAREGIITRSVKQAGAATATPILVVDDSMSVLMNETPGTRLQAYLDALEGAGFTNVTSWNTESQGVPTGSALRNRVVVWFTGATYHRWGEDPTLNADERNAIGHFLDNGGRMVMASGEVATDMTGDAILWDTPCYKVDRDWFEKYFRSHALSWLSWFGREIRGIGNTPYAGIEGRIPDEYEYREMADTHWPTGMDNVVPIDPSARPMLQGGGYGEMSGTSMAAPHVAGALALLQSSFPHASPDELKARLENTVDRSPHLAEKVSYGGRINVDAAARAYPGKPTITAPQPSELLRGGETSTIQWTPAVGGIPEAVFEVEQGLPALVSSFDFESGDLSEFEINGDFGWEITEDPSIVHEGNRSLRTSPVPTGPYAWSSIATTVTLDSAGHLEFWVRHGPDDGYSSTGLLINGLPAWLTVDVIPWTRVAVELPEGESRIEWDFSLRSDAVTQNMLAIDDIRVYEHQYTTVGTGAAGSTEIDWSVPTIDSDQVRLRVRAVADGFSSAWATRQGFRITTDGQAPGAPTNFRATPGIDGEVSLAWENPADADLESVRVLRLTDGPPVGPDDPAATVVYEGAGESAQLTDLVHGSTHHFAIFATDGNYNWSDGVHVTTTAVDTTAPEGPGWFEAQVIEGTVVLTWVPPDDTYSGVRIIRRTDAPPTGPTDEQATLVYDGLGVLASDWALPEVLGDGSRAYYAAWAYDASGNLSELSFSEATLDTTGPEGEVLVNDGASHTASTTVRVDSAVTGATEMRFHINGQRDEDEPWQPFASTVSLTLLAIDGPQTIDAEYRGANGNVLELRAEIYVNLDPPAAPSGLGATPWGSRVELVWDGMLSPEPEALLAEEDSDVAGWNVLIAESEDGPYSQANEFLLDTPRFLASGLTPGKTYWFKVQAVDVVGHKSPHTESVSATAAESVTRSAGDNRFATAVEISRANWAQSDTVVLASGAGFADALGASSLAGIYDAPILLTQADTLPTAVADELTRLGARNIIIVGGTGVVSPFVEASLNLRFSVERIGGRNRYETSARIAERVVSELGAEYTGEVFIASALSHADALAIAPYAFRNRTPVLLVDREPRSVIEDAVMDIGAVYAVVVGGTGAVPDEVADSLGVPYTRLAGEDRFETAATVARYAVDFEWATPAHIGIATGVTFPDALAGGPAIGRNNGVKLLTRPDVLPAPTREALMDWADQNKSIDIFGGKGAVSDGVRNEIRNIVR